MRLGLEQLEKFPAQTRIALADSPYNELDLHQLPFGQIGVLPITLDESLYNTPSNEVLVGEIKSRGPVLLFVSRISPNKRRKISSSSFTITAAWNRKPA
jgi:hypothetical protein